LTWIILFIPLSEDLFSLIDGHKSLYKKIFVAINPADNELVYGFDTGKITVRLCRDDTSSWIDPEDYLLMCTLLTLPVDSPLILNCSEPW